MKVGCFLIDKEGVGNPDKLDIFCTHYKFFKAQTPLEGEARVLPKLSEVHVECKVLQNVGFGCSLFSSAAVRHFATYTFINQEKKKKKMKKQTVVVAEERKKRAG